MPAPNNNKTIANANLQFSNMGNFHNTGREESMAIFKHSGGGGGGTATLPAILLGAHYSSYFHGTQAFLVFFSTERGKKKRSTFPVAAVAQYHSGLR